MKREHDLVVVGDLIIDILLDLPEYPKPESVIMPLRVERQVGGSGTFLIMASRLGLKVKAVDCVGNDFHGFFLKKALTSEEVNIDNVVTREGSTKACLVLVHRGSKSFIGLFHDETVFLQREDIKGEMFNAKALYLSGYSLARMLSSHEHEAVYKAFKICKSRNMEIFFDVSPFVRLIPKEELFEVLNSTKIVFLNLNELKSLTHGISIDESLRRIRSFTKGLIVVKLGEKGALVHFNDEVIKVNPIKTALVDTTGAGDAFNAGFIHGYLEGLSIQSSLQLANIIGALTVKKLGGGLNLPYRYEVEKYMRFIEESTL